MKRPNSCMEVGKLYAAVKVGDLEVVNEILRHATADEVNQREGNQVGLLLYQSF